MCSAPCLEPGSLYKQRRRGKLAPVAAPPPQNLYDLTNREVPASGCLELQVIFAGTYHLIVDGG